MSEHDASSSAPAGWVGRIAVASSPAVASSADAGAPLPSAMPARPSAEFEALYREHFRFVWRCVRRLGVAEASLDDVVQETFLVVHRRLLEFEGRSSTRTWLYGIVRRVVSDHRRSLRRKPAHDAAGPEADFERMHDTASPAPDASLEQSEQIDLVRRILGELDEEKREVFILSELEGMTMAEIAEAIDVNPNTVSSRLRAARRQFEEAVDRLSPSSQRGEADGEPRGEPRADDGRRAR